MVCYIAWVIWDWLRTLFYSQRSAKHIGKKLRKNPKMTAWCVNLSDYLWGYTTYPDIAHQLFVDHCTHDDVNFPKNLVWKYIKEGKE